MKEWNNKVIWITGAGSGLGKSLALELAKYGAKIALSGRREAPLISVAEELKKQNGTSLVIPCDVTDTVGIEEALSKIIENFGQLDVVIANAGFGVSGKFEQLTDKDWTRQYAVNVVGLTQTVRLALPYIKHSKGRIVLIGSVAAFAFAGKAAPYCSSKAAVHAIGECLSLELYGSGVTCTTIHPGFVESDIARVDNQGVFHADAPDKRPAKLMWKADDAARVMVRAIYKRKRIFVFTWHGKFGAFLGRHFPNLLYFLQTRVASWK